MKYPTFGALVEDAMPISWGEWEETADPKCTYMFELVSPYNRVVIPYEETKLYFLGIRDMEDGKEWNPAYCLLSRCRLELPRGAYPAAPGGRRPA